MSTQVHFILFVILRLIELVCFTCKCHLEMQLSRSECVALSAECIRWARDAPKHMKLPPKPLRLNAAFRLQCAPSPNPKRFNFSGQPLCIHVDQEAISCTGTQHGRSVDTLPLCADVIEASVCNRSLRGALRNVAGTASMQDLGATCPRTCLHTSTTLVLHLTRVEPFGPSDSF